MDKGYNLLYRIGINDLFGLVVIEKVDWREKIRGNLNLFRLYGVAKI